MRRWIDEAIELLFAMPFTCALDLVDQYPDGLNVVSVGYVLGTTRQNIQQEERKPHVVSALRVLRRLRTEGLIGPEVDEEGRTADEVRDEVRELFDAHSREGF